MPKHGSPSFPHGSLMSSTEMAPRKKKRKLRRKNKVTTLKAPSATIKAIKRAS